MEQKSIALPVAPREYNCAPERIRTFSPTGKSRLRYQLRHESICICLGSGDMSCTCILWASTTRVDYFRHSRIIIPHRETSTTTQELPRAYLNRFCLNRVIILFLIFLVEGAGFEPAKAVAAWFTVKFRWPLGYPSLFWANRRTRTFNKPHYKGGAVPIVLCWHLYGRQDSNLHKILRIPNAARDQFLHYHILFELRVRVALT